MGAMSIKVNLKKIFWLYITIILRRFKVLMVYYTIVMIISITMMYLLYYIPTMLDISSNKL